MARNKLISVPAEVGERIAERRIALQLSQKDLAELLGTQQCTVSQYERRGAVKLATVEELAEALECSPVWLAWGVPFP